MSFTSASNGRAPPQQPSHPLSLVEPQRPTWTLNQDTLCPNFRDRHLDDSRCSMVLPNATSSRSQVPGNLDENLDLSSSHLPFTTAGSSQSQNFCVSDQTQYYVPAGPLPHASFVTDTTTTLRQPTYPSSCIVTGITHPTMPSSGPSRFGGDQPTWNDHTTQFGPVMAVHEPALAPPPSSSLPLQPFNPDPRAFQPLPTASAVQAQPMNFPNVDITGWHQPGGRASTRFPPRPRGPRTRPIRPPLVRVEDRVVWVRPHVLKITLWLNWSPNAEAEAHEPWD